MIARITFGQKKNPIGIRTNVIGENEKVQYKLTVV